MGQRTSCPDSGAHRATDVDEESADSHSGLTSAVGKVPAEVWGEIFFQAIVSDTFGFLPPVPLDTSQAPWTFSRVCRLWRREITSLSVIWSRVEINPQWYHVSNWKAYPTELRDETEWTDRVSYLLELILQRSHNHPLHISVRLFPSFDEYRTESLLLHLSRHSMRWKSVELLLSGIAVGVFQRMELKGRLPQLERLILPSLLDIPPDSPCLKFFSDAPSLRTVVAGGENFGPPTADHMKALDIPWSQLAHFSSIAFLPSFFELNNMPNLVRLNTCFATEDIPNIPLKHTKLRYLPLLPSYCYSQNLSLDLPALDEVHYGRGMAADKIDRLVESFDCTVRTVVIEPELTFPPPPPSIPSFRYFSTITTLHLDFAPTKALFESLIEQSEKLGQLQTLVLSVKSIRHHQPTIEPADLLNFLNCFRPILKELWFSYIPRYISSFIEMDAIDMQKYTMIVRGCQELDITVGIERKDLDM